MIMYLNYLDLLIGQVDITGSRLQTFLTEKRASLVRELAQVSPRPNALQLSLFHIYQFRIIC